MAFMAFASIAFSIAFGAAGAAAAFIAFFMAAIDRDEIARECEVNCLSSGAPALKPLLH